MQLVRAGALAILLASAPFSNVPASAAASGGGDERRTAAKHDDVVLQWNEAALEAIRRSLLGPPMVARALAVVHTCMYDAWAAYDPMASGTRPGVSLRQPRRERNTSNKREAISVAAYRALVDLLVAERKSGFRAFRRQRRSGRCRPRVGASRRGGATVASCSTSRQTSS